MRTIAIGDIHGCYHTLKKLLDEVKLDKSNDILIFIGDYIDRGKNSYEVIEFLISLQDEMGIERCKCLMGNHERMMVDGVVFGNNGLWKRNGGNKTIKSYHKNNQRLAKRMSWMKELPLIHETEDLIFCHAGLPHKITADNKEFDILWERDWINTMVEKNEKTVIFGHSPISGYAYYSKNGNICIDGGCVYGGNLCALIINGDDYKPVYVKIDAKD